MYVKDPEVQMGTCFLHENRLKCEAPGPHRAPCILLGAVGTEATNHPALTHTQDTTAPGCLSKGITRSGTWEKDWLPQAHWEMVDFYEVPGSSAQLPSRPGFGLTHSRSDPAEKHSDT